MGERIIGIDLGTPRVTVAVMSDGEPVVISSFLRTTPDQASTRAPLPATLLAAKRTAEEHLGESVENAVVAVPAHLLHGQRQAMLDAGRCCGLTVRRLVHASTAAALQASVRQHRWGQSAFYTFDDGGVEAAIIEVDSDVLLVRSVHACPAPSGARLSLDETQKTCLNAMVNAGCNAGSIGRVVLVGDPPLDSQTQRSVAGCLGAAREQSVQPRAAVAHGAGILGGMLTGEIQGLLLDVSAHSLGVEIPGGVFQPVLMRNTLLPTRASRVLTNSADGQTVLEVGLFQGERILTRENHRLGTVRVEGIRPQPRGLSEIEVRFEIDASGLMSVRAIDLAAGSALPVVLDLAAP